MTSPNELANLLLSKINIYVTGACGPKRDGPLSCFQPVHQSYYRATPPTAMPVAQDLSRAFPGGSLRYLVPLPNIDNDTHERAFEWALGHESMCVAIEAFFVAEQGREYDTPALLRRFGEFVATLGTQPVTIPISSIVEHMLGTYMRVTEGGSQFSWSASWSVDLEAMVREFMYTRECFFFVTNCAPVVEACFSVDHVRQVEMDVTLDFTWSPPLMQFEGLRNMVSEGERISFKPIFNSPPHNSSLPTEEEYFIGPKADLLCWDPISKVFARTVPHRMAAEVGAERFESYTLALEVLAKITKHFPNQTRFERIVRCALPLTVKRQPTTCTIVNERMNSPAVPRPNASRLLRRPPLMRSPFRLSFPRPRAPPSTSSNHLVGGGLEKENQAISTEEVAKLLQHKAQISHRSQSPTKLDALSLARFYDSIAAPLSLGHPPYRHDIEVRALHEIRQSPIRTPECLWFGVTIPEKADEQDENSMEIDLGSTHVNRHGKLASRSDSGQEYPSKRDRFFSPPARDITPPMASAPVSSRKRETGPFSNRPSPSKSMENPKPSCGLSDVDSALQAEADSEPPATCEVCIADGREPNTIEKNGMQTCLNCEESSIHRWINEIFAQGSETEKDALWEAMSSSSRYRDTHTEDSALAASSVDEGQRRGKRTTEEWQAQIQANFREFETGKAKAEVRMVQNELDVGEIGDSGEVTLEDISDL